MTTISHGTAGVSSAEQRGFLRLRVREMWASLAIAVTWLAVLFDAVYGPDVVSTNGTNTTRVPSAIFVALFAYLATRVVARYGFGPARKDPQ